MYQSWFRNSRKKQVSESAVQAGFPNQRYTPVSESAIQTGFAKQRAVLSEEVHRSNAGTFDDTLEELKREPSLPTPTHLM